MNFGSKINFWSEINFGSEIKFWSEINVNFEIDFGSEKMWVRQIFFRLRYVS